MSTESNNLTVLNERLRRLEMDLAALAARNEDAALFLRPKEPERMNRFDAQGLTAVVVAGRRWAVADWTGTKSDYLQMPFDATTAPSYLTKTDYDALDWTSAPDPTDDGDIRNDALVVQISLVGVPVLWIPRA